jgi:serine/threonine-protein kinase
LERLAKYQLLDEIGQGGMSVVYRGRDDALDRLVAVKVMHKHLARDPDARERFAREARAVARLTHRNIPEIYDFSQDGDEVNYLVTELVDGAPLSELIKTRHLLPELGVMVCVGVADALGHAHAHKIIHRDVKPENILVGKDGVAKLTDFGIAQVIGLESMTITGTLVGSPAHMSPEQIEGHRELDLRSDVWAMGTVLYVTATGGTLPFDAGTPHGVLKRIVEGRYGDPRRINPHVDSELAGIIERCLQVDPGDRFASMEDLNAALRAWLTPRGLTDVEAEIAAWMADDEAYVTRLTARLIGVLMARAEADASQGLRHRALEAYNRVLTLDPDHEEAFNRVRALASGMRWRKRLLRGGAGVAAAALVVAAVVLWPRTLPRPPTPELVLPARTALTPPASVGEVGRGVGAALREAVDADLPAPVPPALTAAAGVRAGQALARAGDRGITLAAVTAAHPVRPNGRDPGGVTAPQVAGVETLISVFPPAIELTVDGKRASTPARLTLKPGKHRAVLRNPGCFPRCQDDVQPFTVSAQGDETRRQLRWRPRWAPMTVEVLCSEGNFRVLAKSYRCGSYKIPVQDEQPQEVTIQVTLASGVVRSRKANFMPGGRFRWSLE